jgi:hypothetical protein
MWKLWWLLTVNWSYLFPWLMVQTISPAKADEFTLKKNILSTFAWSSDLLFPRQYFGGKHHPVFGESFLPSPLFTLTLSGQGISWHWKSVSHGLRLSEFPKTKWFWEPQLASAVYLYALFFRLCYCLQWKDAFNFWMKRALDKWVSSTFASSSDLLMIERSLLFWDTKLVLAHNIHIHIKLGLLTLLKLRDENTCNSPIPLLSPAFLPRLSPNLARCKFIYVPPLKVNMVGIACMDRSYLLYELWLFWNNRKPYRIVCLHLKLPATNISDQTRLANCRERWTWNGRKWLRSLPWNVISY